MLVSSQSNQIACFQTAFNPRRNIIVQERNGFILEEEGLFLEHQVSFNGLEHLSGEPEGFMPERSNIVAGRNDMGS